tara:strand:- start:287 stop:1654 length:1368 start_codon:yes stop_codon:yes gene_type:complete
VINEVRLGSLIITLDVLLKMTLDVSFPKIELFLPLITALALIGTGWAADAAPPRVAALVIDASYKDEDGIVGEIGRYRELVKKRFNVNLSLFWVPSDTRPEAIRKALNSLHKTNGITGAFLIGGFGFPIFKNECGDVSTMFSYYTDLDGEIRDTDGDGKFDFYNPWPDEGNGVVPVHEIWLAVLKPYYQSEGNKRTPEEIREYFAKVNAHLSGFVKKDDAKAAIFTSKDWGNLKHLNDALEPIYADRIVQRGGIGEDGKGIATDIDDFRHVLSQESEICFVYAHSGSSQHVLDGPPFPGNCILPGVLDYPGRPLLEDMKVNARILSIWGCHALDLQQIKYKDNRFLADSYLFTPRFRTQTILGASRSIGLASIETLVANGRNDCLAYAWHDYLNHCYSQDFLKEWLGVRGVWEKERNGFDWGYCIYGNPFDMLGVGMTNAEQDGGGQPATRPESK